MALDSFKGHSMDMGNDPEGIKEGPFLTSNTINSKSSTGYKEAVESMSNLLLEMKTNNLENDELSQKMFNGRLGACIRKLNSIGVSINEEEFLKNVRRAANVKNILNGNDIELSSEKQR